MNERILPTEVGRQAGKVDRLSTSPYPIDGFPLFPPQLLVRRCASFTFVLLLATIFFLLFCLLLFFSSSQWTTSAARPAIRRAEGSNELVA